MPKVEMYEIYSVTVQVDASYPDRTRLRPNCVWFDTWDEASAAIGRALALLPVEITSAMIHRERVDQFDNDESGDLNDWPQPRRIVNGEMTAEDFQ